MVSLQSFKYSKVTQALGELGQDHEFIRQLKHIPHQRNHNFLRSYQEKPIPKLSDAASLALP